MVLNGEGVEKSGSSPEYAPPGSRLAALLTNRAALYALIILSICTIVLFFLDYQAEEARLLESVRSRFVERLHALDRAVSVPASGIDMLKKWAESRDVAERRVPPLVRSKLRYRKRGDFFETVAPARKPGGAGRTLAGSIAGAGRPVGRGERFEQELALASCLLPLLKAVKEASGAAAQSYYISNEQVAGTYPPIPVRLIIEHTAPGGTLAEAFDIFFKPHAGRQLNPEHAAYWTDVYIDRAGKGPIVTHAAPVYDEERFRGVVAVDITLDFLESFVRPFDGPTGRLIIATRSGNVLVDSAEPEEEWEDIPLLRDRLPPAIAGNSGMSADGEGGLSSGRYRLFAGDLDNAPWTFMQVLDAGDLSSYLLFSRATIGVGALVIASFLILLFFTSRERKAQAVRQRLERENLEMKDRMIGEMKRHEEYVSEAAHELRNPLQILKGSLEHFDEGNLTPVQKKALSLLRASGERIGEGIRKIT